MSAEGVSALLAVFLWRKSKRKFLLAFMKPLTTVIVKILVVTLFRCSEVVIFFYHKNAYRDPPKTFFCIQWEVNIGENRPITEWEADTEIMMRLLENVLVSKWF